MEKAKIFTGMRIEIDGQGAAVKSLTRSRCWLIFDGERVARGFSLTRIRRMIAQGIAKPAGLQLVLLQEPRKAKPVDDLSS